MQRKIIPDAENRLLILYALKTVGAMTDQQLLIVMTDTDLMNYIIQSFSSFYYLNKVPDFTLQTDIGNQAFTCFRINSG